MTENAKTYVCEDPACGKIFQYYSHYQRHIKIHKGEKPFSCTQCSRNFRRQDALTIHQRIHSNYLPYKCSQLDCFESFKSKSGLRYHDLKCHQRTCSYVCPNIACGRSFLTLGQLKQHQKTSKHINNSYMMDISTGVGDELDDKKSCDLKTWSNVLQGFDVFEFTNEQSNIISNLWNTYLEEKQDELTSFDTTQAEQETSDTFFNQLKKELFTVVGLVDKIYRYEKEQKEVEPLSPSQTQRIKEALFIAKSFHNIYFSQNQDR